jgi:hypothetical protein
LSRIVNLRTIRKQQARDTARRKATAAAAGAGESRGSADTRRRETERAARQLDGHRREDRSDGETDGTE